MVAFWGVIMLTRKRNSQKKIYWDLQIIIIKHILPCMWHGPWFSFPEGEALADQKVCNADILSHLVGAEQYDGNWTLICQLLENRGERRTKTENRSSQQQRKVEQGGELKLKSETQWNILPIIKKKLEHLWSYWALKQLFIFIIYCM